MNIILFQLDEKLSIIVSWRPFEMLSRIKHGYYWFNEDKMYNMNKIIKQNHQKLL